MDLITGLESGWELEEAAGFARNDAHGGNHLSESGGLVGSAGAVVGNGAVFDGSGKFLTRASNASLVTGDIDFTFCAWVNAVPGGPYTIISKDSGPTFEYILYTGGDQLAWYLENGASFEEVTTTLTFSAPQFAVAWHDSVANTLNLQLQNGSVISESYSGGVLAGAGAFKIGAADGGANDLNGSIDQVFFWKRVLTADERTWLFNDGDGRSYQDIVDAVGVRRWILGTH